MQFSIFPEAGRALVV